MRVIAGKYRGMTLYMPEGRDIRPTSDRVKESLFNILFNRINGASVLDMFCGSGSLGIECLSRGADFVHFNDASAASIAVLKKNLKRIEGNYKITNADYSACLGRESYDLVFIDPPYASDAGVRALEAVCTRLREGGIAVYERDRSFSGTAEGLEQYDERRYGKTYLTFFKKGEK